MKLPKKYIKRAGGNLKKAWSMFRNSKKALSRKQMKSYGRKISRGRPMKRALSYSRKSYKKVKTMKKGGTFSGTMGGLLAAGLYGGVRAKLSNALAPVTSRIPAGELGDEVGMMALAFLAKGALKGDLKRIPKAAMNIEAARVGEFLFTRGLQGLGGGNSGGGNSGGGNIF